MMVAAIPAAAPEGRAETARPTLARAIITRLGDDARDYLVKLGPPALILSIATLLGMAMAPLHHEGYAGLIFVAAITLIGARSGLLIAIVCGVCGALSFNYFVVEPVFAFSFNRPIDFLPPAVFLVCSVASGLVSGRARDREVEANLARAQLDDLLHVSRQLQAGLGQQQIHSVLRAEVDRYRENLALYWCDPAGEMQLDAGDPGADHAAAIVRTAADNAPMLRIGRLECHRLGDDQTMWGALICTTRAPRALAPAADPRGFAEGLARLANLALIRERLSEDLTEQRTLTRVDQFQSALLMSVSHDLRTPLTAISAAAASLTEFSAALDDATRTELLQCIDHECRRLDRLTTNLMHLVRLETPDIALNAGPMDVNAVLQRCLDAAMPEAGQRSMVAHLADCAPVISAEPALFELAIGNVVQNAIKFSPDGSTITVTSAVADGTCVIGISDQGSGVAPADQELVFRRFHRTASVARAGIAGSGLGLAIARSFVEATGGTIALASPGRDGNSTTVTIALPLIEQDKAA
jgi:two-component system sensor histidine kinase KdpD